MKIFWQTYNVQATEVIRTVANEREKSPRLMFEPLLFITVLEALSKEFGTGCPWENLYTYDLGIISGSLG